MKFNRSILASGLCAMIVCGCEAQSGTVTPVPVAQGRMHRASGSWIERGSSGADLLYIANQTASTGGPGNVYIYTFSSGALVGSLSGFQNPWGICSDSAGNVFVTDYDAADIVEYAHGGTSPIRTLSDTHQPIACSVDGRSGNLGVANSDLTVNIYQKAHGVGQTYSVGFSPKWAAYDTAGNLFVDGIGNPFRVAELPRGGDTFVNVLLEGHTRGFPPAGLQWNQNELVLGSANPYQYGCCGKVFRYTIASGVGQKVGFHKIPGELENFAISGSKIVVADGGDYVQVYDYPSSKTALLTIKEPQYFSYGVTVSLAPTASRIRK